MSDFIYAPDKDPLSIIKYSLDWRDELDVGETLTSATITVDPGITLSEVAELGGVVTWKITGGTEKRSYKMVSRVTTSDGEDDQRTIVVHIRKL